MMWKKAGVDPTAASQALGKTSSSYLVRKERCLISVGVLGSVDIKICICVATQAPWH